MPSWQADCDALTACANPRFARNKYPMILRLNQLCVTMGFVFGPEIK